MLRHYDDIGLLIPAETDDINGDRDELDTYLEKRQLELKKIAKSAEYLDDEYKEKDVELICCLNRLIPLDMTLSPCILRTITYL